MNLRDFEMPQLLLQPSHAKGVLQCTSEISVRAKPRARATHLIVRNVLSLLCPNCRVIPNRRDGGSSQVCSTRSSSNARSASCAPSTLSARNSRTWDSRVWTTRRWRVASPRPPPPWPSSCTRTARARYCPVILSACHIPLRHFVDPIFVRHVTVVPRSAVYLKHRVNAPLLAFPFRSRRADMPRILYRGHQKGMDQRLGGEDILGTMAISNQDCQGPWCALIVMLSHFSALERVSYCMFEFRVFLPCRGAPRVGAATRFHSAIGARVYFRHSAYM